MLRAVFTALFFFLMTAASAAEPAATVLFRGCAQMPVEARQLESLARDETWLRLLHFRRHFLRFSSQADGELFFLSPNGDTNPRAELEATLEGLCSDKTRDVNHGDVRQISVRCQFPARARFLKAQIPGLRWPDDGACPELDRWRERIRPQKISLVFSSYYANNPSSVFGHTLLRADPEPLHPQLPVSPLLSYGINFAAEVGPMNPLIYAVYGLIGRFPGKFAALPYYYKVREYSDFDSRDLWEYELKLTTEERVQLIDHLWELAFTHFNYYYFTENCSYQLMSALEAAAPRLRAAERVPYWVIPADTVKATITQAGLLGEVSFRPSLYRQFEARRERLSSGEREGVRRVVDGRDLRALDTYLPERQALVLDAALDYWDFKYTRELAKGDIDKARFKQELLLRRTRTPKTPPLSFDLAKLDRPDEAHGSMRYGLNFESTGSQTGVLGLDLRFALHDFLDPQEGYPRTAQIEFFRFNIQLAKQRDSLWRQSLWLHEFDFFDIRLLAPLRAHDRHFSWRANLAADRRMGFGDSESLAAKIEALAGGTFGFFNDRWLVFALAGAEMRSTGEQLRLAPEFNLGTRLAFSNHWLSLIEYEREFPLGSDLNPLWRAEGEIRFSPNLSFSLGLGARASGDHDEKSVLVHLYTYR